MTRHPRINCRSRRKAALIFRKPVRPWRNLSLLTSRMTQQLLLAMLMGPLAIDAFAANNIYTNSISGKWEASTNWSLGAPSTNDFAFITNSGSKAVTIDGVTSTNFPGTMTVANLTISSPTNSYTNTLILSDAGTNRPLHVVSNLTVLPGGTLTITNSALTVD